MDRVACCRRAAREAVADVEPPRLHDALVDGIDDASMVPGVLALASAAAVDPEADLEDAVATRAAGVQLVYQGLSLTRTLAHDEPWDALEDGGLEGGNRRTGALEDGGLEDGELSADSPLAFEPDLAILAADILVARGFYLLARTDAAESAVETIRRFGRDQTRRDDPGTDAEAIDAQLERDVLELAVRVGANTVGASPAPELLAYASDVVDRVGTDLPPAAQCLASLDVASPEHAPGDGLPTDRATSASDH